MNREYQLEGKIGFWNVLIWGFRHDRKRAIKEVVGCVMILLFIGLILLSPWIGRILG